MTSPQRIAATVLPISILVCYGIIRFVNLPSQNVSKESKLNITSIIHDEVFEVVDDGVLTSSLYESDFRRVQKGVCPNFGQDLNLLVMVVTKSYHRSKRMAIRKTWGHYGIRNDVSVAFLFGSKTDVVNSEVNTYSDMVIEGNVDTEINRTLKSISMMEFVATRCPKVQYVLKVKDDIFVNIPSLLNTIHKLNISARAIYGHLYHNSNPVRTFGLKTYISENQYNRSILPDYLSGHAYLFPGHIANDIYSESMKHIYVPVEEVFLTGIVAETLDINRVDMKDLKCVHHMVDVDGHKPTSVIFKADVPSKQYRYWTKFNNPGHTELIQ